MIGAVDLLPFYSNAPPYSVVRFTPGQTIPVSNVVSVALSSSVLFDEWGNGNISAAVQFTNGAGLVYYTASPVPQTAAKQVARSALGSPFLYQGQYFDYDAGLAYFRARYYDPYAGSFLEPDPLGYEDSVNNYAAMMNNPVSLRDPSGLASRSASMPRKVGPPRILPPWEEPWPAFVKEGRTNESRAEEARGNVRSGPKAQGPSRMASSEPCPQTV